MLDITSGILIMGIIAALAYVLIDFFDSIDDAKWQAVARTVVEGVNDKPERDAVLAHCWACGFEIDQTIEVLAENGYPDVPFNVVFNSFSTQDDEYEAYAFQPCEGCGCIPMPKGVGCPDNCEVGGAHAFNFLTQGE